ncbi:response regulator transcription factor [Ktedonobacteria bacterium brp13]|nr:response regulator transcription factor [Ktedonobacteria bacterium brp13]
MFQIEKSHTHTSIEVQRAAASETGAEIVAFSRDNVLNMLTELVESMEVVCSRNVFAQLSTQEIQEAVTSWYELAYTSLRSIQDILRHLPTGSAPAGPAARKKVDAGALGMTEREYQLATLLAHSMSLKDIAHYWGVSEKTVRNHLANVSRKLNCQDRVQIVLYALRAGWVELES